MMMMMKTDHHEYVPQIIFPSSLKEQGGASSMTMNAVPFILPHQARTGVHEAFCLMALLLRHLKVKQSNHTQYKAIWQLHRKLNLVFRVLIFLPTERAPVRQTALRLREIIDCMTSIGSSEQYHVNLLLLLHFVAQLAGNFAFISSTLQFPIHTFVWGIKLAFWQRYKVSPWLI